MFFLYLAAMRGGGGESWYLIEGGDESGVTVERGHNESVVLLVYPQHRLDVRLRVLKRRGKRGIAGEGRDTMGKRGI